MYFPLNAASCGALAASDPPAAKRCYAEHVAANAPNADNFTIQLATVSGVLAAPFGALQTFCSVLVSLK